MAMDSMQRRAQSYLYEVERHVGRKLPTEEIDVAMAHFIKGSSAHVASRGILRAARDISQPMSGLQA